MLPFFKNFLRTIVLPGWVALLSLPVLCQEAETIKGFCIAAPSPSEHPRFVKFITEELVPMGVNTLVLRVDYNYDYRSHPELRDSEHLSEAQVKELVKTCRRHGITLVPQINLLGHQSWHSTVLNLLRTYPQFDETPHVQLPEKYEWPNSDGLYCKSYCPRHPEVHAIVFALVDEIMDAFEATGFHAGLDEVFYIGDDRCPRCAGQDKAQLFADEVSRIRDHLNQKNRVLWMWGDRLLDGEATGLGMWEASMNQTHRAIDLIPKDVVICDWHYERPEPTAAYFAMKGFQVITCPWNKPEVAVQQHQDFVAFKAHANKNLAGRYRGMMQTVWSGAGRFMDAYYALKAEPGTAKPDGQAASFIRLFEALHAAENN